MLTEAEAERQAFGDHERRRQHARDYAKATARRDVIKKRKAQFLEAAAQEQFERLLERCEKDADEIACEAAGEACGLATRTELGVAAYEVAYIEAYAEALPALMSTRRNVA
jgi:hypothetical protein